MLLQELLRNWILYREVLKPVLESWKDSIAAGYKREITDISSYELNLFINQAKAGGDGEELGWDISDEYEAKSLNQTSGTHTITNRIIPSPNSSDLLDESKHKLSSASFSRDVYIVLMDGLVIERVVKTGKTYSHEDISRNDFILLGTSQTKSATTGYANQQINSFLFETHEKREYLGEFSLTHEEIPLMYQLRGGEYHDID